MRVKANCKINLGLDILRRREDGYHDLSTIMFPVLGLYDIVEVEPADTDSFHSTGLMIDCADQDNICTKALHLMRKHFNIGCASISLDKRVPFGAGLGGGSSDGTAVLIALNEIFDLRLSEQQLIDLAAELGSDTAFFVRNTPQLCEGRGEQMTPIALNLAGLWLAIIKPEVSVSTREAYAGVKPAIPEIPLQERINTPIKEWQNLIKNDFEKTIFALHPKLAEIKSDFIKAGAIYAAMSGSGSAMFALFDNEEAVNKIRNATPYIFKL